MSCHFLCVELASTSLRIYTLIPRSWVGIDHPVYYFYYFMMILDVIVSISPKLHLPPHNAFFYILKNKMWFVVKCLGLNLTLYTLFAGETALVADSDKLCALGSEFDKVCEDNNVVSECSKVLDVCSWGRMNVRVNGEPLEEVDCYTYLGSQVAADGGCE